jgi:hypothetical protein
MKTRFNIIFLGLQCDSFLTDVAMIALLSVKIRFVITQFVAIIEPVLSSTHDPIMHTDDI